LNTYYNPTWHFATFEKNIAMLQRLFLFSLFLLPLSGFTQTRNTGNWIDFGGDHSSKWLQIAPGKLGPNALLVPDMDYARVGKENKFELGAHYHQMAGDTAINSYFSFYWNIAPGRAAVEIWGQPSESFRISNDVRNDRQILKDDNGWDTQAGDLLISTYVQLLNESRFIPSASINYTMKTTTGGNLDGRFTDAEMNYFYLAAGKSFCFEGGIIDEIRLAGLLGFYVWQTNKVQMGQDEGKVYELGIQLRKKDFSFFAEYGGYEGWDAYEYIDNANGTNLIEGNNDPLIFRSRLEKAGKQFDFTLEYQTGIRDYHYQTIRFGAIYRFKARNFVQR
jgi:hypothetical protein